MEMRLANLEDLKSISEVAKISWNYHYPAIITQEQINYMLGKMYSVESLKEQIIDKKHHFLLYLKEKELFGFVSFSKMLEDSDSLFIHKFYILPHVQRSGIGVKLFSELITYAKDNLFKDISLQVNRKNYKAINFYFKLGFYIDRVEDFQIGKGFEMNDFIMIYKLNPNEN